MATHVMAQSITDEFPIPTINSFPFGITTGPDGALWFTESNSNKVGRITTAGVITEFPIPTKGFGITAGPDGALWFTSGNGIGRITTAGAITEFQAASGDAITAGPDGALWFTSGNGIGRITTTGVIAIFPIPTPNGNPQGITTGPDGALWFTESNSNKIGRITTAGVITEFPIPTGTSNTPQWHHRRLRRCALVHGAQRQQDRTDHDRRCDNGIPDTNV
jgi:virginiamycin B lyase